jgi:hypothetical protein
VDHDDELWITPGAGSPDRRRHRDDVAGRVLRARSEYPGGKPTRTDALLQFEVASRRS